MPYLDSKLFFWLLSWSDIIQYIYFTSEYKIFSESTQFQQLSLNLHMEEVFHQQGQLPI